MNTVLVAALKASSQITHPITMAAFAAVLALAGLLAAIRTKRSNLGWVFAPAIFVLGVAPLLANTYVRSKGIYRVRVQVVDENQIPVRDVDLTADVGQKTTTDNGWEYTIVPQQISDGTSVTFRAVQPARTGGKTSVELKDDYFPNALIVLEPLPSVAVRGEVLDSAGLPVEGADVSVAGWPTSTASTRNGSFALATQVPAGQQVTVRAQKSHRVVQLTQPSTTFFELTLAANR